jgi:NAD-reducing hydrogenase large subunit
MTGRQTAEGGDSGRRLRRIAIDPVTRVEGHGKVTLLLDEDNRVARARLHIVEFRGFEKFIQGRPSWELPVTVQRLCGICPVSHHLAAAKALDQLAGVDTLPPTAEKMRRLMHYGQVLQSHALHFFHLASPDLVFGYDAPATRRNIFALLETCPDIARKGIGLRKFGQQVIEHTTGKRIHGNGAIPGGVNQALAPAARDALRADLPRVLAWAQEAVALARELFLAEREHNLLFASRDSSMLCLLRRDGALDLYHGGLWAQDADGRWLLEHADYRDYETHIHEQVRSWSYLKFPFLASEGPDAGSYRVGALARLNNCRFLDTPLAEAARRGFRELAPGRPVQSTLAYHWARMVELLHCAETVARLLDDPTLCGGDLVATGEPCREGIGVLEAPRGTLFHHYAVDDGGLVTRANLIVSTTNNNQAMNDAICAAAAAVFDGREVTEPMLNRIEVAIRAYDPCLSCATHALGRMPMQVELLDARGATLDRVQRGGDGTLQRPP